MRGFINAKRNVLLLNYYGIIFGYSWVYFRTLNSRIIWKSYLGKLHQIHSLCEIPMKKSLPPKHGRELICKSPERLLDCCAVIKESCRGFTALWWYITYGCLQVVWNPFHKGRRARALHVGYSLFHISHGELTPEHGGYGQVSPLARVARYHSVFWSKHAAGQLADPVRPVGLGAAADQGRVGRHEEVEARKRNHIDCQLAQVGIKLQKTATILDCKIMYFFRAARLQKRKHKLGNCSANVDILDTCKGTHYIHSFIHTYIHTYIRTYVRTYIHTHKQKIIYVHIYIYVRRYLLEYIHVHTLNLVSACN